ncbi:MAG: DUF1573 domain-containing protein [Bacteroidetes bacterium]|nr:DUF1573 domain-containing protein [Bacteroidota bacterium]MCL2302616.1 DUF1573 domain-containing protein [Lentimicrobiaceae bacterium]
MNTSKTKNQNLLLSPFFFLLFSFSLLSCGNSGKSGLSVSDIKNPATADGVDKQQQANMPIIQFENLTYNFGKVIQGEMLSYTFHFRNVGKSSLLISGIEASCGCTTSVPPRAPIQPGEKGEVKITFDSKHKIGEVISYLVVTANTYPAQTVLTVNANVINP